MIYRSTTRTALRVDFIQLLKTLIARTLSFLVMLHFGTGSWSLYAKGRAINVVEIIKVTSSNINSKESKMKSEPLVKRCSSLGTEMRLIDLRKQLHRQKRLKRT